MSQALITRDDSALSISFTGDAIALRDAALDQSALIAVVGSPEQQAEAVAAQQAIHNVVGLVEKARKEAKQPVLDFGKKIDEAARQFVADAGAEQMRLAKLVGDYQALEAQKVKAAEAAENKRLAEIERQRMAEIAKAKTHEDVERINERHDTIAQQEKPAPIAPARAAGQVVREDWKITVTNEQLLASAHPMCVTITPKLAPIKAMLDAGVKVQGIHAEKETKSTVRFGAPRAIEV